MSSVEVLGALDGYPPLLTIDEAAEALRIGRSLAYEPRGVVGFALTRSLVAQSPGVSSMS
jgi:hypothetical protein